MEELQMINYDEETLAVMKDDVNLHVVMEKIKDSIAEQLQKCGLYYRLFYRVKSNASLLQKIRNGSYGSRGDGKMIQDLIGIRIVLYYTDDLSVCRRILEKTFTRNGDWSENERTVNQFQATKINGVFEIPQRMVELIDETTWKLPVDATFEVQLRTVLFEGWHEIEHDMRYKDVKNNRRSLWKGNEELARIMNSILASLELCDWSLSSLFENLARKHLEKKNWDLMLRSRYRIRLEDVPMKKELVSYLDKNEEVAWKFFNCDKKELVNALMDENVHTRLTYDVLMKVLNNIYVKDERVARILSDTKLRVYEPVPKKNKFRPLENRTTFRLDVALNPEHDSKENLDRQFYEAASIIYNWGKYKYREVFPEMHPDLTDFRGRRPGYELHIEYDAEHHYFLLNCDRIDSEMPGTIWYTETRIEEKGGRLLFFVITTSSAPESQIAKINFRKPKFVDRIHEKMDFYDVSCLRSQVVTIETPEDAKELQQLVSHPARCLPVIVANWDANAEHYSIRVEKLLNTIGSFAHVYGNRTEIDGAVTVYWQDRTVQKFTREEILASRFDYNRKVFTNEDVYELPFRHHLVNMVRERNNGIIREVKN